MEQSTEIDLGEEGLSFKEIALGLFKKCSEKLSVELRGGYHYYSKGVDGSGGETYVVDTREEACNCIMSYALVILPKFDKVMKESFRVFEVKLDKLKAEFIDSTSVDEEIILGLDHYETKEDMLLLETFKIKKLELFVTLFKDLSLCTARCKYFTFGGGTFE